MSVKGFEKLCGRDYCGREPALPAISTGAHPLKRVGAVSCFSFGFQLHATNLHLDSNCTPQIIICFPVVRHNFSLLSRIPVVGISGISVFFRLLFFSMTTSRFCPQRIWPQYIITLSCSQQRCALGDVFQRSCASERAQGCHEHPIARNSLR